MSNVNMDKKMKGKDLITIGIFSAILSGKEVLVFESDL